MPRRVLFVAYYFPPMGGAGVQRSVKFVRYLGEFGWEPIVLTADVTDYEIECEFQLDEDLAAEVGRGDLAVVRVSDPGRRRNRRSKLFKYEWFLRYRSLWEAQVPWARTAARECVEVARRENVDVVYTSLAPYSAALIGNRVKRELGIPWVADLRDLWTEDALRVWPSKWHFLWERALERRLLRNADRVIANSDLSKTRLCENLAVPEDRVTTIPNGFDPCDFEGVQGVAHEGRFVLTHVGAFRDCTKTPRAPRWPLHAPVAADESARSPLYVFRAVEALLRDRPQLRKRLQIRLVGFLSDANKDLVERLGLGDVVEATGYVGHARVIAELVGADALLLLQVAFADADRPVPYVPGKMYEYFAANKPILAPLPPGDTRRMVARSGLAFPAPHNDVEKVREVLEEMIAKWEAGALSAQSNADYIGFFERKRLTGKLSRVFEEVAPSVKISIRRSPPA